MKTLATLSVLALALVTGQARFVQECLNTPDGLYAIGPCEPRFLTCSGGIARIMDCPADLIYQESLQLCDWPHNVLACQEESSGDDYGYASGYGAAPEEDTTGYSSGAVVEDAPVTKGAYDVVTDAPTEGYYETTTEILPQILPIQPEADTESPSRSGYEEAPVEVTTTAPVASDAPVTSGYEEAPVEAPETTEAVYEYTTTEATTVPEVASEAPSTSGYEVVPVEITTTTTTEAPVVASDAPTTTEYEEVPVEVTTSAVEYGASEDVTSAPEYAPRDAPQVEASGEGSGSPVGDENVCANRADGAHSFGGCTNYYFICTANAVRFRNCPTPLFFDAANQKCSWKHLVEECHEEVSTSEPAADPSASSDLVYNPSCDGQADGIYSIGGCSNQFLTCSGGVARVMDCPDDLIFNPSIHVCDHASEVADCSALPASSPSENKCSQDGYFSFGQCSSQFTACTNGRAIVMFCPAGLKFSEATQMCDYERNVSECPSAEQDQSGEAPYAPNSYPEPVASGDGLTPCANLENGLYALGCTARVLSCQNGHEDIFECPSNLVFNEHSLICDYPQTSDKCEPEDSVIVRDVPVAPVSECSVEGLFSDAVCSSTYHQCHAGQLVNYTCAEANAVFSVADAECVDASLLYQCKKTSPLH